jgi:hypothetical protein
MRRLVALALVLAARPSLAYDFEVTAETIGQGYQLRAADDTLVNRRRLLVALGLAVYNLGPRDPVGRPLARNQIYVALSLRLDTDLGDFPSLRELVGRTPERDLRADRLDILYAYVGGHDLAGFLDFRLGRQIQVDLFDYLCFDGLHLEAKTPFHVAVEAWGGLSVTGAAAVDSPIYRTDGVALGGNPQTGPDAHQEDALAPTLGVAVRTFGLRDVSARLSYLRTVSFTDGTRSTGVVDEKLGFTARGRLFGVVFPWFGFRYNLLAGLLDELQAGARAVLPGGHALTVEYVYAAPTFDGDSIWNVFGAQAFNDARLTWDFARGRFRLFARAFVRRFGDETTSWTGTSPSSLALASPLAGGGAVGLRVELGRGYVRADGYYEDGWGGVKAGVDVSGRVLIVDGLSAEARVSYVHFEDDVRPIDHADSFGLSAGARYLLRRGLALHLLVEENVNRFYASQFRVVGVVDVATFAGPHTVGFTRPQPWVFQ